MHCVTHVDLLCHGRFNIEEYPYLCMAYKIPPRLSVVVPIKLKVDSNSYQWYDIPITGPEKLTLPVDDIRACHSQDALGGCGKVLKQVIIDK